MSAALEILPQTSVQIALERLVQESVLTPADAERARRAIAQGAGGLVDTLIGLGILRNDAVADALARHIGVSRLDAALEAQLELDTSRVTARFQEMNGLAVCQIRSGDTSETVTVLRDPTDIVAIDAVRFALRQEVRLIVATTRELEALRARYHVEDSAAEITSALESDTDLDLERLRESASDAPIVKLVQDLISEAVEAGASDLHFDPHETRLVVRQRLDGILRDVRVLPITQLAPVISRLKIMASLDIGERRLPQDGAISTNVRGRMVDLRIATAPSVRGEAVVVRILNQSRAQLDLEALGFSPRIVAGLRDALTRPNGLFLVTGPTGSGKSTTLYAALRLLNDGARKILTIEDPVEFKLDGVTQVQVRPDIGLTFASALRSMLRHDPDVILVGEIRDAETAKIAIQAALTGHLVLASLHTNSAVSAVTRLRDMGIEPFLIASTLIGVMAQRLARRLCESCKVQSADGHWIAVGCVRCGQSGYAGRVALAEYFNVSDESRRALAATADEDKLAGAIRKDGWPTLESEMSAATLAGITTHQ